MLGDSNKTGAGVVLLHGCPQSCMQNPVEGLLEVYEDLVEVKRQDLYLYHHHHHRQKESFEGLM